jgi:hypothetical protein
MVIIHSAPKWRSYHAKALPNSFSDKSDLICTDFVKWFIKIEAISGIK